MDVRTAGVTTSVDTGLETINPNAAVILVVPVSCEDASPLEPAALLMVATAVFDEDQVARVVRSCRVPSSSVPVAENCFEVPFAILVMDGDVIMANNSDVVSVTELVIPLNIAEISVVPGAATADARPVALIPAIPVSDEPQVAKDVRFCTALFASVPEVENCSVIPGAKLDGVAGDRDIETVSDVVSVADPVLPLYTAVMTVEPVDVPAVARPEALIPAMLVSDDVHVADRERSFILPFE